jgi:O-antigen ligase
MKFYNSYLNEFNAHNEYLSILLKWGLAGLILFLYILCRGAWMAWQRNDVLFFSFIVLIAVVSLSENLLDLNKGIFFYAFFFSFFLKRDMVKKGLQGNILKAEEATPQSN